MGPWIAFGLIAVGAGLLAFYPHTDKRLSGGLVALGLVLDLLMALTGVHL